MRKTILIVEDEQGIALLFRDLLEDEGYAVLIAADGEEGLRRVYDAHPDLVLSNVQMPHLSGADLARAIRADPALDAMPLILMSAGAAIRSDAPCDGFVEKPFQLDTLVATVARLLDQA